MRVWECGGQEAGGDGDGQVGGHQAFDGLGGAIGDGDKGVKRQAAHQQDKEPPIAPQEPQEGQQGRRQE